MYRKRKTLSVVFAIVAILSLIASACAPAAAPSPTTAPAPAATRPPAAAPTAAPAAQPTKAPAAAAPTTAPTAAPQPTKPAAAATTAPTAAPAANLARDQVLRLPSGEPPTIDPGLATDTVSVDVIVNLFEGLLEFDANGKAIPLVAESWEISKDGTVYTFKLRKGPTWSDGTPVTAKDFEYAWKRNLDPKTASDYGYMLYPIKGAEAYNTGKATDPSSVGVQAKDDQTLVITLVEPAAYFLRLASTWTAMPLPKAAIEKNGDKWTEPANIVTNGPFKLTSWKHGQEMVLDRNDKYWGTKPTLAKVQYRLFADSDQTQTQVLAAYENGEIDALGTYPIPPTDVDRILKDAKLSKEVRVNDVSGTYFLVPNSAKKPFDNKDVRKALSLAIDPKAVIDVLKSPSKPADTLMPPGILGRNPSAYAPRPNVNMAKEFLAKAGYPNGQGFPEFTYTYNTSASHKAVAEYLQEVWSKQLGVKVKLENMEWKVFLKWRKEANYDMYRGGWLSDYEDPNNWFNVLLDSAQSGEVFSPHWKNEKFDQLVRQARGEADEKKREDLYKQADAIIADEMPFIPIYYNTGREMVKPYVDGWNKTRVLDLVYFKNIRVLAH
ncbi:MAG: peptide ABC transporter substrate-binding protein [Chloroflexi bacterium]|nr:peptide ABC transporter substrate-binding protein [Chloroflexota bacterium]